MAPNNYVDSIGCTAFIMSALATQGQSPFRSTDIGRPSCEPELLLTTAGQEMTTWSVCVLLVEVAVTEYPNLPVLSVHTITPPRLLCAELDPQRSRVLCYISGNTTTYIIYRNPSLSYLYSG
jgi:hypothetical protein